MRLVFRGEELELGACGTLYWPARELLVVADLHLEKGTALARRGSPKVRLDLLTEMLDPERLREVFVVQDADGKEEPNEALVVITVTGTLRAVADLHRKRPEMPLERARERVEELTASANASIATEVARLERLGAKVVDRLERWVVMQAPTGQRFCVVRVQRPGFPKNANRWD